MHDFGANPAAMRACRVMNDLGAAAQPFVFVLDYALHEPLVVPLQQVDATQLKYWIRGAGNDLQRPPAERDPPRISVLSAPSRARYQQAFDTVQQHLRRGNSYLVNLTLPTRIAISGSLVDLFYHSEAKYRVWLRDRFVAFSPEPFVTIADGVIRSCPMKGTRSGEGQRQTDALLADPKEYAEHVTIVDLIRNDIGRVARRVSVERFRYVETLKTDRGSLLQMSSEIVGRLAPDWPGRIGDILLAMLPPGSVTGAPKQMTCHIIAEAEGYQRGFYTGVTGLFDGQRLDSGVLIRFVEQTADGYLFKSGGGITIDSRVDLEYQELLDKIYVPLYRDYSH